MVRIGHSVSTSISHMVRNGFWLWYEMVNYGTKWQWYEMVMVRNDLLRPVMVINKTSIVVLVCVYKYVDLCV